MEPRGCRRCTDLDVVLWSKDSDGAIETRATSPGHLLSLKYDVAILFPEADQLRRCEECRADLAQTLAIPNLWWSDYCRRSNGYFGCEDAVRDRGAVTGIRTWCRLLVKQVSAGVDGATDYDWYKLNVFTTWQQHPGRTTVLVFDPSPSATEDVPRRLLHGLDAEQLCDPFWMYVRLVEEVVGLQDGAVWAIRNVVRAIELRRWPEPPAPDYAHLHDMARHAIHVSETLGVDADVLDSMLVHHQRIAPLLDPGAVPRAAAAQVSAATGNRLLFYRGILRSLHARSASNRERLQNEIGLAFNVVAQSDARISVQIGRAAQADSAAMRTVAFVTLAFLPATFVCAVFSMPFFHYDSSAGSWSVSGDLWRYWAVAVPVTVCTALLWLGWSWLFRPAPIGGTGERNIQAAAAVWAGMVRPLRAVVRDTPDLPV